MPPAPRPKRATRSPTPYTCEWGDATSTRARAPSPPPGAVSALDRVLAGVSTPVKEVQSGEGGAMVAAAAAGSAGPGAQAQKPPATPRRRRRGELPAAAVAQLEAAASALAAAHAEAAALAVELASARAAAAEWRSRSAALAGALEAAASALAQAGIALPQQAASAVDVLQAMVVASPTAASASRPPSPPDAGVDEFDLAAAMLGRLPSYKSWEV